MKTGRYVQAAKATALAAVVILSGLAGVGPAAATDVGCGSVITTDITLTHNMTCPGDGFLIGADNVTINLGGFVLEGTFASGNPTGQNGIETQGHSGVVVMNGTVRRFSTGVLVTGPASNITAGGSDNERSPTAWVTA